MELNHYSEFRPYCRSPVLLTPVCHTRCCGVRYAAVHRAHPTIRDLVPRPLCGRSRSLTHAGVETVM